MHQLMSKIEKLQEETGDGPQPGRGGLRGGDEFKRLKAHIAQDIREIRLQLKQRDALMQKGASGTKQTAQLSHSIREQLKAARDDANRLKDLHRKGKGGAGEREERGEVVELVFKHIDEVEALDKRRHTSKASASRRPWPSRTRLLTFFLPAPSPPKGWAPSLTAAASRQR